MKVTAFLGSPRARGNTDVLAGRLLEGAREAGSEAEAVELRNLKIHHCIGCEKCWQMGAACVYNDDMAGMYKTIEHSDVLVFVTPVYWYAPTTIFKAFMDRLVPFNRPQGRSLIEGKGAVLVTAYEETGSKAAEPMLQMFEMSFGYLGLLFLDRVVVDGVGPKGAVLERPEALKRAYDVGRSLVQ